MFQAQICFCQSPFSSFALFLLGTAYWKHWQKTFCPAGGPARTAGRHRCQFCPWGGGGGQPKSPLQIQWVWKIPFIYRGPGQSSQPVAVALWSAGTGGECSQQHWFRSQPGEGRVEVSRVWMKGSAICFFPGLLLSDLFTWILPGDKDSCLIGRETVFLIGQYQPLSKSRWCFGLKLN